MNNTEIPQSLNVVLFDGVCNLCNVSVQFILKREKGDNLRFASLQSEIGQAIAALSTETILPDSIIFYKKGVLYTQSNAVIELSKFLKAPWCWVAYGSFIPEPWRDTLYIYIAQNRYKWFGKREVCSVPTPEQRGKFLADY